MALLWHPGAQVIKGESGGSVMNYPPKGVLHTTEGASASGAIGAYIANNSWPHFTISFEKGWAQLWQHLPIDTAARALRHPPLTVQTNRANVIQVEIVGRAALASSFPRTYLDGIASLMRWIEANAGVPRSSGVPWLTYPPPPGQNARMSKTAWLAYSGWCGHQHVPRNTHGDPGAIDIDYLLGSAPTVPIPPAPVYDVQEETMKAHLVQVGPLDSDGNGRSEWNPGLGREPIIIGHALQGATKATEPYPWAGRKLSPTPSVAPAGNTVLVGIEGGVPGWLVGVYVSVA